MIEWKNSNPDWKRLTNQDQDCILLLCRFVGIEEVTEKGFDNFVRRVYMTERVFGAYRPGKSFNYVELRNCIGLTVTAPRLSYEEFQKKVISVIIREVQEKMRNEKE
jgi:hypothetical protein